MRGGTTGPVALLALTAVALAASAIAPFDRATWWMEVAPVLIAAPILVVTYRRFRFTMLAYALMTAFALVMITGGHWSYARVPLGEWVKDLFHLSRNHFDRLGHLLQGVVPAIVTRELLVRTSPLRPGGWLFTCVTGIALAISAIYELIEWASAVILGSGATEFLGTQGDPWDTQEDMLCAFLGAMLAQVLLSRLHDRQIAAREGLASVSSA